ncbi:MAG: hypothetical protein V7L23_08985 [Nostoc sp.]|uniref:hypothetical protein n=1 Tax=Nostoc sp. TaxID=1180 RepID=UPI002FF0C09A
MQIYLAIRNRGYTNQVRLRGLKKLETHGGGFCLYSREFYSPGLPVDVAHNLSREVNWINISEGQQYGR